MKTSSSILALAALVLSGANALSLHRRHAHAHDVFPRGEDDCQCTTFVTGKWMPYEAPTSTAYVESTVTVVPIESTSTTTSTCHLTVTVHPVPTPELTTCPTPGIYTIPAKTITLTKTIPTYIPTYTVLPSGTHYIGAMTTVVAYETTITCPYATISSSATSTWTTMETTIFTCPSSGVYTYGGMTTTVTESTTCEYPIISTYYPGTYSQMETTVTVTKSGAVITCPYETPLSAFGPTPYQSSFPASTYPTETPYESTEATYPTETPMATYPTESPYETSEATYPTETPYSAPAPKPKHSHGASSPYSKPSAGATNQWAITYSPYNDDSSCRDTASITADIKTIADKGFKAIRIYSTECNGLEVVSDVCEAQGLKLILGVFIKAGGMADAQAEFQEILEWGKWDLVEMVVIGNEAIFNGWCTAVELASFIASCKAQLVAKGCNAPVTTAEPLNIIQANPGLCAVVDVVGVNIHPYFNSGCVAGNSGPFVVSELAIAAGVCNKPSYCLETGWPSAGLPNGVAIPGTSEQMAALQSIYSHDEGHITYFTFRNDGWKQPGALDVEQNFGCGQDFPLY